MKCLVLGNGLSGRAVCDLLIRENIEFNVLSSADINKSDFKKEYLDRLFFGLSFIIVSPGIDKNIEILKQAKKRKIKIIGELEYGANRLKCNFIAITGTNGKTTTVSLINYILKDYDNRVFLGGNIGVPVSAFADKTQKQDIAILECSSFQLEKISKFKPKISAILNITPDHLNRHKTMKNYIGCKYSIAKYQSRNDYLLLNGDDEILVKNPPKTKAQILYFSTKNKVNGCYIKRGCIYFNDNLKEKKLVSLSGINLVGEHNLSNILCAVLAVYLLTKNIEILSNIKTFNAVPHRIEFVKNINGISFYNDSKATNIDSTKVACKSFKNQIHLILGGSDKGYDFDKLFENLPKNVKNIAIFGETKHKIALSAKKYGFKNFYICENLEMATLCLFGLAKKGDVVLLSPACASFDFFSNYEERGTFFKKIVKEIDDYESSNLCNKKKE